MSKPPNENVTTYKLVVVGDGGKFDQSHLIKNDPHNEYLVMFEAG